MSSASEGEGALGVVGEVGTAAAAVAVPEPCGELDCVELQWHCGELDALAPSALPPSPLPPPPPPSPLLRPLRRASV